MVPSTGCDGGYSIIWIGSEKDVPFEYTGQQKYCVNFDYSYGIN